MISIIIPTLQEEGAIGKVLQSLRPLSRPHEIIVSDGGSTDATRAIAQQYGVTVIAQEGPPAVAKQRNAGAQVAHGDILVFIDAGVSFENPNTFFDRALHYFEDPGFVALGGRIKIHSSVETLTDRIMYTWINWVYRLWTNVFHIGSAQGKFHMVRRTTFQSVGGYREDFATAEDIELFQRLTRAGKTHVDKNLVVYHTGRREHALGWPRLLWLWSLNSIWFTLSGRPYTKVWKPIR